MKKRNQRKGRKTRQRREPIVQHKRPRRYKTSDDGVQPLKSDRVDQAMGDGSSLTHNPFAGLLDTEAT